MLKKIGFDIHGVIDKNPDLFAEMIAEFYSLGYEIHILTGSLITPDIIRELRDYGIRYDFLFSILGYHRSKNTEMWEDDRGFWIDDDLWEMTKAMYCKEHEINFHMDDTRSYGDHFTTPFGHITPIKENPRILEITGDVDDEILCVFKKYEGYFKMSF